MRTQNEDMEKLKRLLKEIRIAMLTTVEPGGKLRSRPMATTDVDFNGDLWFFTQVSSHKVDEVQKDQHVNIGYVSEKDSRYASITGTAQLVRDKQKMTELWKPFLKAWFPKGLEDPELALLQVTAERAEYWDTPPSAVVQMVALARAVLTGAKQPAAGDYKRVDLQH